MEKKAMGAAAVILDGRGYVLLVKHSYGHLNWEVPGGGSEPNESVAETAVRETREETGLDVTIERLTGIYYDHAIDMHHFAFAARLADPAAVPHPASEEITACGFFPPDALPRPISDFTARRIEDALAGASGPLPIVIEPRRWLE